MRMSHIELYTSPTCPYCRQAKEFLSRHGIAYTEHDISRDDEAAQRLEAAGIRGTPAFNIDGRYIVGFDRPTLEALLLGKIVECPKCRTRHRAPRDKGRVRITCAKCGTKFDVMT